MKMTLKSLKTYSTTAMAFLGAAAIATSAMAQSVTLKSSDGSIDITGEFVTFDDNSYVIRTALGDLRVGASEVSCTGDACPVFDVGGADVVLGGAGSIGLDLMPLIIEGYASSVGAAATVQQVGDNTSLLVELIGDGGFGDEVGSYLIESSASADAFSTLLGQTSEIGMSSRRITRDEARALSQNGAGLMINPAQEHLLAVDSIVVVTHPNNPVETLTISELGDIYTGKIRNWSEVGGPDMQITPISLTSTSGTREVFEDRVLDDEAQGITQGLVVQNIDEVSRLVNSRFGGIGYVGIAYQRGAKPLSLISECGQIVEPSSFATRTGEYPLDLRLYLYTREDTKSDSTQSLLDYATSARADAIIEKAGLIGFSIDSVRQGEDSARAVALRNARLDTYEASVAAEMSDQMASYDRLSSTFRFSTGSSNLDERGRVDMQRLISFLEQQGAGSRALVVGFTDDLGAFDANRRLSQDRARDVLAQLRQIGGDRLANVKFESTGFGEIAPAGCNVNKGGRAINRRVEIWFDAAN